MTPFTFSFLLLASFFVLDVALAPNLEIGGAKPDFVLIFVAIYALVEEPLTGSVVGFFGGLLEDLVSSTVIGLNAFSKSLVGYIAGLADHRFLPGPSLAVMVVVAATVFDKLAFQGLLFLLGQGVPFKAALFTVVLPSTIYNGLVAPLVFVAIKGIFLRENRLRDLDLKQRP